MNHLLAPALNCRFAYLGCVWTVFVEKAIRIGHGVTEHFAPLSHPLSKVTKCCILSRDPYDNTVCAAFEQQVNLLSLWALNSWTIHPSQAFLLNSEMCLLVTLLNHKCCLRGFIFPQIILHVWFTLFVFCTVYFVKANRESLKVENKRQKQGDGQKLCLDLFMYSKTFRDNNR